MNTYRSSSLVDVLGIQIAPLDMEGAIAFLSDALHEHTKGYVCLTGVHGIMEAHRDPDLRSVYAHSLLSIPDGMPTVWVGHWQGHPGMRRVAGPDLMLELLGRKQFAGYTHFLYGGKPGVAQELQHEIERRFPSSSIVGTYTPPFHELSPDGEAELIATVRALHPDIIWVGISTPKQERFMHRMLPRLETTLMFGVGAAFDFHTGRIDDCAEWIKLAGLQWLDRLRQNPQHLWKRYLRNNPAFLWHILLQLSHLRTYPVPLAPGPRPNEATAILHKVG